VNIITSITEAATRWFPQTAALIRDKEAMRSEIFDLQEGMSRLQLELENEGYRRLTVATDHEFDRAHLETLIKLTAAMAIKNPLICRAVNVQSDYVFGRGVRFVAQHPVVQAVIDEHVNYAENQKVLYSHNSMSRQERELQVNGNLFFALPTNPRTGRVTVRDIPTAEVADIIRDPQDYHNEWFIKRTHLDGNNHLSVSYHPALGITKDSGAYLPAWETDRGEIVWNAPVYHASFNQYGRMKFGIPELYPSIDWALAYKRFLEDWTSIMRAFARMAMKISGLGGKQQAAAAKSKLQTSVNLTNPLETNPSPTAASMGLFGKGVNIEPVKTAGATTPAKDGQPLLNMTAAGIGLPNTFFGDASQARGDTLDRPTELKMVARQRLWAVIFSVILDYVLFQSAKCLDGDLRAAGATVQDTVNKFDDSRIKVVVMPTNDDPDTGLAGQPISTKVQIKFPELLERNVTDRVRALVNALTQFGKPLSDIIPDKRFVVRLLLEALNVDGIDDLIPQFVEMWTKNMKVGDDNKPIDPIIIPPLPATPAKGAEDPAQGGDVGANG
jgi:hypothetical protein